MDALHSRQGDTLDGLLWRERGLGPEDLPPILSANPGIAALGAVLPIGTAIRLPELAPPALRTLPLIQLWS